MEQIKANYQTQQNLLTVSDDSEIFWLVQVFLIKSLSPLTLTHTFVCYEVFECSLYTLNTRIFLRISHFSVPFNFDMCEPQHCAKFSENNRIFKDGLRNALRYNTSSSLYRIQIKKKHNKTKNNKTNTLYCHSSILL